MNFPHPQDMSMYSLCSDHWNHIRRPSSRNVDIRQSLASVAGFYHLIEIHIKVPFKIDCGLLVLALLRLAGDCRGEWCSIFGGVTCRSSEFLLLLSISRMCCTIRCVSY
ncbi:hypothetical protein NQ318_013744 [Aromia moschata]|uniref:Uncharacterized protein n=1 Tax=Aromia moschata TaxID=1265417 RepID=A0AAV8Z9G8_9CUCU|nr:hypothetical protein NQ318_013744 [Aromia moschata]